MESAEPVSAALSQASEVWSSRQRCALGGDVAELWEIMTLANESRDREGLKIQWTRWVSDYKSRL
jgi:hypothetical protein